MPRKPLPRPAEAAPRPRGRTPAPYYKATGVTLYHGDCRTILPTLRRDHFAVMVTDPPYGVACQLAKQGTRFGGDRMIGDETTDARDAAIAWAGDLPSIVFGSPKIARPAGLRATLVWDKGCGAGMGDMRFPWRPNWEEIYVFGRGFVGRRTSGVLRHNAVGGRHRWHLTEKPTPLLRALLENCPPGPVIDPFAGGGTTLVVARELGREAVGIEFDEAICERIVRRLEGGRP